MAGEAEFFRELILRMGMEWYGVPRKPIRQNEICGVDFLEKQAKRGACPRSAIKRHRRRPEISP